METRLVTNIFVPSSILIKELKSDMSGNLYGSTGTSYYYYHTPRRKTALRCGVSSFQPPTILVIWETGSNIRSLDDALNSSQLNLATWANTNKLEVSLSKRLGLNLDSKLHWGTHIAETSEKGLQRLNPLKRLTANKVGSYPEDVLSTVYKTYVRPVLDYGCEVVTLASTTNLEK
ncbi:hypothetical protein TNCV_1220461 [Trichonephila clavipes]|nr:hypothetical protein TNCV_1220461 [Trichonephila clavipes]